MVRCPQCHGQHSIWRITDCWMACNACEHTWIANGCSRLELQAALRTRIDRMRKHDTKRAPHTVISVQYTREQLLQLRTQSVKEMA